MSRKLLQYKGVNIEIPGADSEHYQGINRDCERNKRTNFRFPIVIAAIPTANRSAVAGSGTAVEAAAVVGASIVIATPKPPFVRRDGSER